MKSRIISLVIFALCLMPHWAKAQITASNPLEWMALAEGNEDSYAAEQHRRRV